MGRQSNEGETAISSLDSYFGTVPDPRAANATHRLGDLIVMMIAASLCGASNATEFSLFAHERKQALSRLIEYEVAPSHDTFSRLLRLLDPVAFGRAFAAFAAGFARACQEVVSLDGKALRRAYEKGLAASPPLTVSAFAAETRRCLAVARTMLRPTPHSSTASPETSYRPLMPTKSPSAIASRNVPGMMTISSRR
ncbi:ISAs1 family transposase [Neorhizobium sp. Rsf11]|uniref:ISAs1 family transposase n=2 Tax=Neorhizobium TaxID=1525371 RepID=A0ABV0MF03_9HYPH|nr:ISAs1 family transposase [Neorhizobium petrolearium]MCC2613717.1 ISAs1 family transposase [Neorhizobium petrolearium]WGI72029.1 ISAs1 family transposase [Neorhizobium petrolearium]